jgi:hypothetical protein
MLTKETVGGVVTGCWEARADRTARIWAQGAAHGAWK